MLFRSPDIISQAHKNNIKIHAWFIVSGDRHYVETHPGSEVVRIQRPDSGKFPVPVIEKGHVNLAYPEYKNYFFTNVKKALEYGFDGIMLDKIRYTSLVYTWDEIHTSKALRAGVNMNKVMDCALKTLYGSEDDKELFVVKYRDGDKDIRKWIDIKKADIEDYVKESKKLADEKHIQLSTSFMPEGSYDDDFADVYYAQNYKDLSRYLDFIVIMAYAKDFNQPASWLKLVTANAKFSSSCKIWPAVQGFNKVDSLMVYEQVKDARIAGADAVAVFQYDGMTPSMWSAFTKGADEDIKHETKNQISGIVYAGGGTIRNCVSKSCSALLKADNFIPFVFKAPQMNVYNNLKEKGFVIIPGGGGSEEAEGLFPEGLANIEKFVRKGGGYIGICAGSYLPGKGYYNNHTKDLQIVNAEPLDVDHWNRGSGKVDIEIKAKDHPVFKGIDSSAIQMQYYSGPVLVPSNLDLPPYKELAIYKSDMHENGAQKGSMLNKTAILESDYKKGKVILFGPHPELTPGLEKLLINAANYVSGNK